MGEIGGDLTEQGFKHHEEIATSGTTDWGENVLTTLELATIVINNPNGPLENFNGQLQKFIMSKI